jgi:hypothetical protein
MEIKDLPYQQRHQVHAAQQERRRKVREQMAKRTHRNPAPYTWSMGYNTCTGRSSPGRRFEFTGSSLNRSKQLSIYEKDIYTLTIDLLAVAAKIAAKLFDKGVPSAFRNCLIRQDIASQEEYRVWLRLKKGGDDESAFPCISRILSPRSRGKIKDKATAFFRSSPGSRTFVTLTFIAAVADADAVGILNKFLTVVRKRFKNVQYLWVAERQGNGNIHFHMIINKRLPVKEYNGLWVLQQYNAGLVGKNKYGEVITKQEVERRQIAGTVGKIFNPFDVKKVRGIAGLSAYLTKYITKQSEQPFACAPWHCSRSVSRLFTRATVAPSAFAYMASFENAKVDKLTGECFAPLVIKGAYWVMVYVNNKKAPLHYLKRMEQINKWIIQGVVPDRIPEIDDDIYSKYFINKN